MNDSMTIDNIPAGGLATFRVLVKTPPQSSADWSFRADVGSDTHITVCSVLISQYGYAVPCLNESTPMRSIGRTAVHGYQIGWLDLYKLSNVGKSYLGLPATYTQSINQSIDRLFPVLSVNLFLRHSTYYLSHCYRIAWGR